MAAAAEAEDLVCDLGSIKNATDMCAYARLACGDVGVGAFGSYVIHWFCAFHTNALGMLPLWMWLVAVMLALCSTADVFLMPQLTYISDLLKLKPDVAGVTLLAFGNGAASLIKSQNYMTAHGSMQSNRRFPLVGAGGNAFGFFVCLS